MVFTSLLHYLMNRSNKRYHKKAYALVKSFLSVKTLRKELKDLWSTINFCTDRVDRERLGNSGGSRPPDKGEGGGEDDHPDP